MPTYDYRCQQCNQSFSAFHGMREAAPPCPACGSQVRKLPVAPAFVGTASARGGQSTPTHSCAAGACGCKYQNA